MPRTQSRLKVDTQQKSLSLMATEAIEENPENVSRPTTAGMTTRVVKGSLWTLAGQVAPLGVSLFTTPFTIRLLGAESYGVLILIGLIPTYLGFADFGMGMASTKFGSEAYAEGDEEKEARIVRTAALIALCSSVPVAAALMVFAAPVVGLFNVPETLRAEAVMALRLAAVTFVVNFLCGIFNTPQLARLRMDLNTAVNTIPRILGLIATPIVIYLGYGIVGAVAALLAASLLQVAGHLWVSRRLLPALIGTRIETAALRPLIRFGGPLVISTVAGILLANGEKGILGYTLKSADLAHYSIAFTLANFVTMFAGSIVQSILPAFSRLSATQEKDILKILFNRMLRITALISVPLIIVISILGGPFLSVWVGEEIARASSLPFYLLIFGLAINILAYYPLSVLLAFGKSPLIAKIYWGEIGPYLVLAYILTSYFGIAGAAIAWSIRVIVDALLLFWFASVIAGLRPSRNLCFYLTGLFIAETLPATLLVFSRDFLLVSLIGLTLITISMVLMIRFLLSKDEKDWFRSIVLAKRFSYNCDYR